MAASMQKEYIHMKLYGGWAVGYTVLFSVFFHPSMRGVQWLSGKVFDLRSRDANSSLTGGTALCP